MWIINLILLIKPLANQHIVIGVDIVVDKSGHDDTNIKVNPLTVEIKLQPKTGTKIMDVHYKVFIIPVIFKW